MTASQSPKQIPWPVNVRQLRQSKTACEKLRIAMQTWSKQDFTNLTTYFRNTIKHFLDTSKLFSEQDSGQWKAFLKKVARDYPALERYTNLWPVEVYVEKYLQHVYWRRPKSIENPASRCNGGNNQDRGDNDEVDVSTYSDGEDNVPGPAPPQAPKQVLGTLQEPNVMFVGKTPPRFQRLQSKQGKTNGTAAQSSGSGSGSDSASTAANNNIAQSHGRSIPKPTSEHHELPLSSSTLSRQNKLPTIGSSQPMQTNNATLSYPIACFGCGFLPSIPELRLIKLRKFLAGMEYLLPIFARVGILHDHQLQVFLKWSKADRTDFFEKLVPHRLSNFQVATINTKILGYPDSLVIPAKRKAEDDPGLFPHLTKIKLEAIEGPSEEEGDDDGSDVDDDNDEDDEDDEEDIPLAAATAGKEHQTPQREFDAGSTVKAVTSAMPKADSVRCPGCAYIPLVVSEFSLELKTFLRACAMEELMPAFTSLGIFTDNDFEQLSKMCEVKRDELFRKGPVVKLNEFQCKVLQLAFRQVNYVQ